jgi:hypothetical protein
MNPELLAKRPRRFLREASTWFLFFLISAGLGYPALNRYDPRKQLPDAAIYAQLATAGPSAVESHLRFRVLVPFLARGVLRICAGYTGTWDPLILSFLLVNACFVATTAYLLLRVGTRLLDSRSVPLLGAALYLLNFAIANLHLAALVDSAEACLLMAIVASMFYGRWGLLPLWGILGTLAKESFVPFSIVMAISWWFASEQRRSRHVLISTAAMVFAEIATLVGLQSILSGHIVWPWNFALSMNSPTNYGTNLAHSLSDRNSWYILLWLLPLGLAGIKRLPRPWLIAAGMGTFAAVILNAYHSTVGGGGGGIGRYIFDVAGPMLSLSAAAFLSDVNEFRPAAGLD